MKLAILEHRHRHGHDIYVAMVGDQATMKDQDAIVEEMIERYGIDYEPTIPEQDVMGDGEEMELRLEELKAIPVVPIGFTGQDSSVSGA